MSNDINDDSESRHRDVTDGDYSSEAEDSSNSHMDDGDSDSDSDAWDSTRDSRPVAAAGASRRFTTRTNKDETEVQQLSRRTNHAIRAWRIFILLLITGVGIGISVGTWIILKRQAKSRYIESYTTFSRSIHDTSAYYMSNLHSATRNLAQTITTAARVRNQTFPFVTVGVFETLARHALQQSAMEAVLYSPLVSDEQRADWEAYATAQQGWISASQSQYMSPTSEFVVAADDMYYEDAGKVPIAPYIWNINATTTNSRQDGGTRPPAFENTGPYLPTWMMMPLPESGSFYINSNRLDASLVSSQYYFTAGVAREGIFSQVLNLTNKQQMIDFDHLNHREIDGSVETEVESDERLPHAFLIEPVFDSLNNNKQTANVVGYVEGLVLWDQYMTALVPEGVEGIYCVVENTCGQSFTFELEGSEPVYTGPGDLHEAAYDDTAVYVPLYDYLYPNSTRALEGHCEYFMTVYASRKFEDRATTNIPAIMTASTACIFVLVLLVFMLYDCFVERRNSILLEAAEKSHSILSSLFPQNVRERLFAEQKDAELHNKQHGGRVRNLKGYLDGGMHGDIGEEDEFGYKGNPIADLFTESTVLFADISGFTAWSSQREPAQVFTLLETLYRSFDEIAKKRGVFKVETIGDCYVAVTGVPEPQKEHTQIICRFARDMLISTRSLVKRLETKLGPDTGDLDLRIGIHSGPVTAGVLRGERSRFQLFGDTMNTASRTESTGLKGKIQISQEAADQLIGSNKAHWIVQRSDRVVAKGKGEMTTYWLVSASSGGSSGPSHANSSQQDPEEKRLAIEAESAPQTKSQQDRFASEKTARLVAWNSDVLARLLKQIVARRQASNLPLRGDGRVNETVFLQEGSQVIDEVKEIIALPDYDKNFLPDELDLDQIELGHDVMEQLFDYVSNIASLYRANFFHSFEHGSHVTMSVTKLLSRIVAPTNAAIGEASGIDSSYGITNDPIVQFSCVFSALIHDVDHPGIPNSQLVEEKTQIAHFYKNQSVAEQNSVELAWTLLSDDSYSALRRTIYTTNEELRRFRALVVNSVMATDIVDKELKTLRNKRWEKAFSETAEQVNTKDARDRKATIVIEHLIQASDVAHTMQHWHIYRKWNERFFFECYKAYKDGRAAKDPSESWFVGELGFYDFYIIPLARKLKDCGVFGVSSEEYLNYAQRNRTEWESKGQEILAEMLEKAKELGL